jgi:hypothetical protein
MVRILAATLTMSALSIVFAPPVHPSEMDLVHLKQTSGYSIRVRYAQ